MKQEELKYYLGTGLEVKRIAKYERCIGTKDEFDVQELSSTIFDIMTGDGSPHWTAYHLVHHLDTLDPFIEEMMQEINSQEDDWYLIEGRFSRKKDGSNPFWQLTSLPHWVFMILVKYHVDVFGWINQDLAIDKSKLQP